MICPRNTHSSDGDIGCTRCPTGWYSPDESSACFPNDKIGGIIRLDMLFEQFDRRVFERSLANALDAEVDDIDLWNAHSGSTVVYFSIEDPDDADLPDDATTTEVRRLSGNEKMLLFYQWWVMSSPRLDDFLAPIIDLRMYLRQETTTQDDDYTTVVIHLFAPASPTPSFILPPQPILKSSAFDNIPGFKPSETTLKISVTVAGGATLCASMVGVIVALLVLML